jgi:hypothetical protein
LFLCGKGRRRREKGGERVKIKEMKIKETWQGEKLVKLEKGKEISGKRKVSREWGQRGEEKKMKGKEGFTDGEREKGGGKKEEGKRRRENERRVE